MGGWGGGGVIVNTVVIHQQVFGVSYVIVVCCLPWRSYGKATPPVMLITRLIGGLLALIAINILCVTRPFSRRPDMTFAVDWALNNHYLSIPFSQKGDLSRWEDHELTGESIT